jgi:hypothetical protein
MPSYFSALKEYCVEYSLDRDSDQADRLKQIYSIVRTAKLQSRGVNKIVAVATRLSKSTDFRQEGDKELLRKRNAADYEFTLSNINF